METIQALIGGTEMGTMQDDWVRKDKRNIDLDQIVYELCIPGTTWKRNPSTNVRVSFPASTMNRYARAWNLFICHSIMPSGHHHDVTVDRAILLFGILSGKYVDIAYVIHQNIMRFLRSRTGVAIPHATIVTKLCTAVGVRWSADEQLQMPGAAIDHAIIERLPEWQGGYASLRGLGYRDADGRRMRAPPPISPVREIAGPSEPVESSGTGRRGFSDSQFRRLARRMDTMHDMHSRFARDLTQALGTAFRATGVDVEWPMFGADMNYPPADSSPDEGEESDRSDSL